MAAALVVAGVAAGGLVLANRSEPTPATASVDKPIKAAKSSKAAARGADRKPVPTATPKPTPTKTAKPSPKPKPKVTKKAEKKAEKKVVKKVEKKVVKKTAKPTPKATRKAKKSVKKASGPVWKVLETKSGPATFFGDASEYQPTACGGNTRTTTKGVALWKIPCGTMVRITSKQTGKSVIAPVEDRGPAGWTGAVIDLLPDTWDALGVSRDQGRQEVTYEVLSK
ncbi:septal ring lytic transglycosylase RlpA family protein [Actinopolymorpha sp. NPDC004070]|uniref:septal ring lytic transglycosylase RlpA family protein n=1 Tax=Actinopolymorpha sp. NPDC004070 TaxID=3154548 RepID=UPI0033B3E18E